MSVRRILAAVTSAAFAGTLAVAMPAAASATVGAAASPQRAAAFVVSQGQFEKMFPGRNSFYTYKGLVDALGAFPGFAHDGSGAADRREAAAFLANVGHETGGLKFAVEQNAANYGHYCDKGRSYGCPGGQAAYYGRGPLQLSWNYNYKAAGDALHIDLLHNPSLVEKDPAISWETGLWFWNSQTGAGTMTPHAAMSRDKGFGETIRSINGDLECKGKNSDERQDRIDRYKQFAGILGVDPGANLSC